MFKFLQRKFTSGSKLQILFLIFDLKIGLKLGNLLEAKSIKEKALSFSFVQTDVQSERETEDYLSRLNRKKNRNLGSRTLKIREMEGNSFGTGHEHEIEKTTIVSTQVKEFIPRLAESLPLQVNVPAVNGVMKTAASNQVQSQSSNDSQLERNNSNFMNEFYLPASKLLLTHQ